MVSHYCLLVDVEFNSLTSRFLLLSNLTLRTEVVEGLGDLASSFIENTDVSFPVFRTGLKFTNMRFEGKKF